MLSTFLLTVDIGQLTIIYIHCYQNYLIEAVLNGLFTKSVS